MEESIELAVRRAITTMRENLGEQLTVDDMARAALFSKFHFTRIFQRVTGVSPGRFLSAVRLQRAKHLLVTTSLKVADISQLVGYNSVGTFSTRFSRSVGMPPTVYRRRAGFATHISSGQDSGVSPVSQAQLTGHVLPHDRGEPRLVFIGLFVDRIPEGKPVRCTVLPGSGRFQFDHVPPGTWYLLAQSVPAEGDIAEAAGDPNIFVATHGPIRVSADAMIDVHVELKPVRSLDPPVLLALLDARKLAMTRLAEDSVAGSSATGVPPLVGSRRQVRPMDASGRTAA